MSMAGDPPPNCLASVEYKITNRYYICTAKTDFEQTSDILVRVGDDKRMQGQIRTLVGERVAMWMVGEAGVGYGSTGVPPRS